MANYGTIVVVDDNPAILTAVKICLAGEFDRVLTLASPDMLLTVLAQEVVDGILLDMNFTQGGKLRTRRLALASGDPQEASGYPGGTGDGIR